LVVKDAQASYLGRLIRAFLSKGFRRMNLRNLVIWGVIVVVLVGLYSMMTGAGRTAGQGEITYSQLLSKVNAGEVKTAVIRGNSVEVKDASGKTYLATTPNNQDDVVKRLEGQGADISVKAPGGPGILGFILNSLPILLMVGVYIFFMRQMQGGARGAMGFGKSKAKLLTENMNRVTFDDVAGIDEAKEELQEVVEFLRDPQKFQRLGGRIPKRRAAGRPARHRQDPDGPRRRG
jgi:cell division protease FtsH